MANWLLQNIGWVEWRYLGALSAEINSGNFYSLENYGYQWVTQTINTPNEVKKLAEYPICGMVVKVYPVWGTIK